MPNQNKPLYLGIDLGTTNSTAAVFDGAAMEVVRTSQGGVLTPSVVRLDARGHVLVGARARRYLDSDPANTRSEFKRLMGTAHHLEFPALGATRRPEELAAEVLKSLRSDVAEQFGITPERAVISVPALFELHQTAATAEAARLAGFAQVELIQEPVASAIAAGWSADSSDGSWLVYDLGGGTFDVSLLETREGLLRVVGHDGDNFLGGRDFDRLLVDLLLARLADDGIEINHADPQHAVALRRLRFAAEEAKIELTRAREAPIFLAGLELGDQRVDVDVVISRAEYEQQIAPLLERSLAICLRLMAAHGLAVGQLQRLVLVGGPTVTPLLRARVQAVLQAGFGEGLDPMTLVAQGAALFAGTVGLDGRPATPSAAVVDSGPKVWLQFPAMTSDLTPYVVGKRLEPGSVQAVQLEREDGGWQSEVTPISADDTFMLMVNLLPRQNNTFRLFGFGAGGQRIPLSPAQFAISHGVTLGEPPLARSIGVALANNEVLFYFERGAPLPIRRSFTLKTVETAHPGQAGYALKVPIVQGEFLRAHLCRLVGSLEIPNSALERPLPIGSEVEVLLELDRGGQLRARARITGLERSFDEVALLVTPQLSLDELDAALERLQQRADELARNAFIERSSHDIAQLSAARSRLEEVRRNIDALRGGDLDAGEQARRGLAEFDAALAEIEAGKAWPEMAQRLEELVVWAVSWTASFGTDTERSALDQAVRAAKDALAARNEDGVERQFALIRRFGHAAYYRSPGAWESQFNYAIADLGNCTDLRRANELANQGNSALQRGDLPALEGIVRQLWELLPVDREEQLLGHGSGVRQR